MNSSLTRTSVGTGASSPFVPYLQIPNNNSSISLSHLVPAAISNSPPPSEMPNRKIYKITNIQPFYYIAQQEGNRQPTRPFALEFPIFRMQNKCYVKGNLIIESNDAIPSREQIRAKIHQSLKIYKRLSGNPLSSSPENINDILKHSQREGWSVQITSNITSLQAGNGYQVPFKIEFTFAAHAATASTTGEFFFWTLRLLGEPLLEDIVVERETPVRDAKINCLQPLLPEERDVKWASDYQDYFEKQLPIAKRMEEEIEGRPLSSPSPSSKTSTKRKRSPTTTTTKNNTEKNNTEKTNGEHPKKRIIHSPPSQRSSLSTSSNSQSQSTSSPFQKSIQDMLKLQETVSTIITSLQTATDEHLDKDTEIANLKAENKKLKEELQIVQTKLKEGEKMSQQFLAIFKSSTQS